MTPQEELAALDVPTVPGHHPRVLLAPASETQRALDSPAFREGRATVQGETALSAAELLNGLFGTVRRLYKRVAQYSYFEENDLYTRLAGQPYAMLVAMVGMLIGDIPTAYGMPWIVSYVVGIAILFAVLWFVGKPSQLRTSE